MLDKMMIADSCVQLGIYLAANLGANTAKKIRE